MKLRRRIGSVFLAFAMALSLIPSVAVSALAAGRDAEQYVTLTGETTDADISQANITVKVVDSTSGALLGQSTYVMRNYNNYMTISLTDSAKEIYDIEDVDGTGVFGTELSADSFRINAWAGSSAEFTVYLCPQFERPTIVGDVIDTSGVIRYRITQASLLKLLRDNGVQVTADTKITKQQAVKAHLVEPYGTTTEWSFNEMPTGANRLPYYHIGEGLSDIGNHGNPNNIRYIEITYQQGNGQAQKQKIYSGDLRYINVGNNTYEIESDKNLNDHIVIFYKEDTADNMQWEPMDVRFIADGQPVGTLPAPPTHITDYDFVAWTQEYDGGLPVLETTYVKDDMNVFPQYTRTNLTQRIHVMNNDELLQNRLEELFADELQPGDTIDWNSLKITVHGINGEQTNPDYYVSVVDCNKWDDDYGYYLVYNYGGGIGLQENESLPISDIDKITVTVDTDSKDRLGPVTIERGPYAGDFSVSTGAYEDSWLVEFYINAEGDYPENPKPDTDPAITDFSKELVDSAEAATEAGITGTYTFPNEDGKVIIPYGEEVTLLYAIKVTGDAGTTFTVTDQGADLVSTGTNVSAGTEEGTFTGSIPADEASITFYVSKTFDADDIVDGKLTNNASITSADGVAEDEGEDGEETPAEEESYTVYTYVEFVGSGNNGALTESDKEYIESTYSINANTLDGGKYLPLGSFTAPLPDPGDAEYKPASDTENGKDVFNTAIWEKVKLYLDEETFNWVEDDYKDVFDLSDLGWYQLCVANGALTIDPNVKGLCWHLDGKINVNVPNISVEKALTEIQRDDTTISSTDITEGMTLEVGDVLTWTITVTNSGNKEATGLKLSDTLVAEAEDGTTSNRTATVTAVTDGVSVDDFDVPAASNGANGEVEFTATYTVTADDKGLTLKNTATVTNGDDEEEGEGSTENEVANPAVDVTKALTSAKRGDNTTTSDLDTYKAQVGDELTYTITVTNEGNTKLTDVKVTDSMWVGTQYAIKVDGAENYAGADGFTIKNGIAAGGSVTITYTYTVQDSDVAAGEITNTAGVYLPDGDEPGEEPDDTDEIIVNMDEDAYTITITPADIVIYTGGTGYIGVTTNEEGTLLGNATASGLPEPGYHIELPEAVNAWLEENGIGTGDEAANLADILDFAYNYDNETRSWDMTRAGVYDANAETGAPTQYVYTLDAGVDEEGNEIPVRILFKNGDEIVESDKIVMTADAAHANYTMTINPGELDQSQIKAVFTTEDGSSITCNVNIGTGDLTVKSVADENPDTNAIAANGDAVADGTLAAVDNGTVDYYVNDSEVKIENVANRVQLLVDSVSNNDSFNNTMAQDAISEVVAKHGNLSDAQTDMAYLDLVDTQNGNAVVTMGDGDELTIYWPMPEDADPNGEFRVVHYTEMDRTDMGMQEETPEVKEASVTQDGNHLTFTTDSFSPFVLVYEQKDSGGPTPPVEDDDDDTPPPVNPNPPQLNTEDHYAYIVGYEDGTVRPEGDITRAEVATIFFRLLTDESRNEYWSQTNDYNDVAEGDWYNNAVSTLSKAGILNGYEDGSFQPNGNITRAEFATIAARFFEATYEGEDLFPDIEGHWARDYINQAAHAGIVNGYEDGTFQPQENITRAEAMTIVNRTLDRHPDADHFLADMITWPDNLETAWYYEQVQEATNSHEYIMKTDADKNPYEIWKEILPVRDWSDLENTWSEAHAG